MRRGEIMSDEIKEILDRIKNYPEKLYCLNNKEKTSLLDYITNLQQENEYLKMNNPEQNMEHFKIINENKRKINNLRAQNIDLQQENEILKINSGELQNAIDNIAELLDVPEGMSVEDVYDKVKDYKSRVEKAIEYIKGQDMSYYGAVVETKMNIILTLLQGGKDDNN